MTGKEKCEFLKEIRKNMAEINGIPYEPHKCEYEGECYGTCFFCDQESDRLLAELKKKKAQGVEIKVDEEAISFLESRRIGGNRNKQIEEGRESIICNPKSISNEEAETIKYKIRELRNKIEEIEERERYSRFYDFFISELLLPGIYAEEGVTSEEERIRKREEDRKRYMRDMFYYNRKLKNLIRQLFGLPQKGDEDNEC